MTVAELEKWEQTRKRGDVLFCIQRTLLIGSIAFIVRAYHDAYVQHLPTVELLMNAIEPTLSGCIAGLVEGLWEWNSNEKRYSLAKDQMGWVGGSRSKLSENSQRGTLNGNKY